MPQNKKRLEWADTARDEYMEGLGRIAEDSPANAALVQSRIEKSTELLRQHPLNKLPSANPGPPRSPNKSPLSRRCRTQCFF